MLTRQHIYIIKQNKSSKHLITKINKITHEATNLIPLENQLHLYTAFKVYKGS